MPEEPQIGSLSYRYRKRFFGVLVVVFLVALPVMIFYTTGYRLSFSNEETAIVTTGGVYITTDNLEVDVFLDAEQVERPRLFRSAYYVQNIAAGQHQVVVQRPDLHTWVKNLPVDPHIVIEAAAFNMPKIPHLRPITEYTTATGTPVFVGVASTTEIFVGATTTTPVLFTENTRVISYEKNEEYLYVESLFSTSTEKRVSIFDLFSDNKKQFGFATTGSATTAASTTVELVEQGDMRLVVKDDELYATWMGTIDNIPHYFCLVDVSASSTAARYGEHIAVQMAELSFSTSTPAILEGGRVCRPEIKLDRLRQDVYFYDFFPDSNDLVLLQLEDGLYVTEIDDRSWQNVQQIYPGNNFEVVVENDEIYIRDGEYYFELITEIEPA